MEGTGINHLNFDYKGIVLDEIALEGLEGTGLKLLWSRLKHRLSYEITDKLKRRLWNFIITCNSLQFFHRKEPAIYYEMHNKFDHIDEDTGYTLDHDFYVNGPFEICVSANSLGSCKDENTRCVIPKSTLSAMTYEEVVALYGDRLVIVASLEERWRALAPGVSMCTIEFLKPLNYVILELIGRARENGLMTVGKTILSKISSDPKILFYHRKKLEELHIINSYDVMQVDNKKSFKSILLRLSRYNTPKALVLPTKGKIAKLRDYLLEQPRNTDNRLSLLNHNLVPKSIWKMVGKKIALFKFEGSEKSRKNCVKLISDSEESSCSDTEEQPVKCKQKIAVNIYKQAYDAIKESGLNGLSQSELAHTLGVGFYASRNIIRCFTNRKIVKIYTIDQGKQKTCKYVLRSTSGDTTQEYAIEKGRLVDCLKSMNLINKQDEPMDTVDGSRKRKSLAVDEHDTKKRIKEELDTQTEEDIDQSNQNVTTQDLSNIVPIKLLIRGSTVSIDESLKDSTKCISMRGLKILNAVLKVIGENEVVETCAALNSLVSKQIGPPAIETQALKRYISKLGDVNAIRVFRIHWPNFKDKSTLLICAHNVRKDHPKVLEIHKRICTTANHKHKVLQERKKINDKSKLFNQSYSRFLKIQKLHEFVYNLVYVNPDNIKLHDHSLGNGFVCIKTILLEMPIELAIGHLSVKKLYELNGIDVTEIEAKMKVKDAPPHISQTILYSNSFVLAFKNSIEILASLGLMQVCFQTDLIENCLEDKGKQMLYVNRRPKLIDTRGVWPPPDVKPAEALVSHKRYNFLLETLDDVKKYWSQVFVISVGTKVTAKNRRLIDKAVIPVRDISQVQKCDNGELLGDGLGPAGFHSLYHTDIIQLWQPFKVLSWKMAAAKQKPKPAPVPKEFKKRQRRVRKKTAIIKKKIVVKKEKSAVPIPRRRERKPKPEPKCVWSKKQDEILLWCKVAVKVMSPLQIAGSVQVTNLVAKDLLHIWDRTKTVSMCCKRYKVLDQTSAFILREEHLVTQARSHRAIVTKYEGLLKKLRLKHMPTLNKYLNEAKLRCLELVSIIKKLAVGNTMRQQVPAVALDYEEFHDNFFITFQNSRSSSLYTTPAECSSEVATVKEGIVLVLCIGYQSNLSPSMSTKVYNTFKQYPERTLRIATEQLHKSGAVSIRDKFLNLQYQKASYSDIIQYASGYKISSFYQRRWVHRLNDTFLDNALTLLESCQATGNIKPSSEMSCFLNELQAQGAISIVTSQPPSLPTQDVVAETFSLTELEMRNKFKSGSVGWINKSNVTVMKDLYKNIDCANAVRDLVRNASVQISEVINVEVDLVLKILEEAGEKGKTFKQLRSLTGYEAKYLQKILMKHEDNLIVKRVGFSENYIVLTKYIKAWCINTGDDHFIPSPWFQLGLQIMYPIFQSWSSAILNNVFENPGSTVSTISEALNFITPRSVQEICMFLQKCECVVIKILVFQNASLFTDDDCDQVEYAPFNKYESPQSMAVFPVKDTIIKFVNLRKNIEQYCLRP